MNWGACLMLASIGWVVCHGALPQVSLQLASPNPVAEGSVAKLVLSRIGTTNAFDVDLDIGGSGTPDIDYREVKSRWHFPTNLYTREVPFEIIEDFFTEDEETIEVAIRPSLNYTIGKPASIVIRIKENDSPGRLAD